MKKTMILTALVLAAVASVALAVDAYTVKQVRDPRVLAARLDADFASVVSTGQTAIVAGLSATITNIPAASVTSGNMAEARMTNVLASTTSIPLGNVRLTYGTGTNAYFAIDSSTQLWFIVTGLATNVLDSDITSP